MVSKVNSEVICQQGPRGGEAHALEAGRLQEELTRQKGWCTQRCRGRSVAAAFKEQQGGRPLGPEHSIRGMGWERERM